MKNIAQLWLILLIGLIFVSCTNPGLKPGADSGNDRAVLEDVPSDANNTDSGPNNIELDEVYSAPLALPDSTTNEEDMTVAVDDYIWRELSIAQEYFTMGVVANRESAWEEAQYYFEKSLEILGELDIVPELDSTGESIVVNDTIPVTPEVAEYNSLLADIIANYKKTLLSLGHLPSDISADALMRRFSEINHLTLDSSEFDRLETYAEEKVSYNVPIVMNERVKKSILYYQTVARDAVERYLSRSTKYLPLIDSIFTEMGVPTDIKHLALVESGYNPHAYSWARAMGLWQFISSTGRMYGLHRTWWYDERKDPVKATIAAGKFLKDLYDKFGSWELAMAAYNGGPGRVSRQIRRQNTRDFWKLDLRKQTEDYVPFFMAATMISKEPEKFGFKGIDYQDQWEYDQVKINRCLDLKVVGEALGCSVKELKELNPELLRRFTPPNKPDYYLRIPKGKKAKFLAAYDSMPSSKETSFVRHRVTRGESVWSIARTYGVSMYAIFEANNINKRTRIFPGQSLVVPVPNDHSYSSAKKKEYKASDNVYTVRAGDTVWDIARAFGTSTSRIRRWNSLDRRARIYVGQQLKVGETGGTLASNSKSSSKKASSSSSTKDGVYVVRKGDTLWDIAKKFGTTTGNLRRINGFGRSSRIYPGQKILVTIDGVKAGEYTVYTVRRGDTLSDIARLFRVPVSKLIAWNDVNNPRTIPVGFKLKIYND